jgi:hypothetical protein
MFPDEMTAASTFRKTKFQKFSPTAPLRPGASPLAKPFSSYFTTTVRAGSPASSALEMLGPREGAPLTISYARVRLF